MNKQNLPTMSGSISRLLNSPLSSFIDEFFDTSIPSQLITRAESYPKYNISRPNKDCKDKFTVELAVAGFTKDILEVYLNKNGLLVVKSLPCQYKDIDYLYKGIATRDFEWSLKLPQYAEVTKTKLENGILSIDVEIKVPEEKQRKVFTIE